MLNKCFAVELKSMRHPLHSHLVSALWVLPPPAFLLPHPLLHQTGWPPWAGNPSQEPREGTLLLAALLRVRSSQFLSLSVMCGAAGWVEESPIPEALGRGWVGPSG